jgi:hypothetical protein
VARTIAVEGSEFSSLACAPSIDFDGTVAFTATRNGRRAIFTRSTNNTLTQVVDDSSPFADFDGVALNQQGGLAFTASLQGGGRGLFRIKNGVRTKIADTNTPGTAQPAGFSINESGQVVFELSAGANGSAVFRGPGGLFGRLIGSGSVLFGRTVAFAHVGRDALNSTNQIAVWIIFTDGSEIIARGDPVSFPDTVSTGALQITTAMGKSVSVDTPIPVPPAHLTLSFDVTFLTADGELSVKLGDAVIKSVAASDPGVPQHVSIPIDVRASAKERPLKHMSALQFSLTGKPGASAQIADVMIPGLFADRMEVDALSRWRVDHSGGGSAAVVGTGRLPVRIRVNHPTGQASAAYATVAVLSTRDFDAPADIERSSLRLAGSRMRISRDEAGREQVACEARDVNGDKLNDLVCEIEAGALTRSKQQHRPRLEAMTRFGWGIAGSDMPRVAPSPKAK